MKNTKNTCLTPKAISEILKKEGVRPTIQRVAICQYVLCNDLTLPKLDI